MSLTYLISHKGFNLTVVAQLVRHELSNRRMKYVAP